MLPEKSKPVQRVGFFHYHSLSIVTLSVLLLWIILYCYSNPNRHAGAFYGNAIADWSGSLVIILITKYFFESGSGESRPWHKRGKSVIGNFLRAHSLSIFLIITGLLWLLLYLRMDSNSKWGQVVGNILSEWVQMFGLVWLTKGLIERRSRESSPK